MSLTLDATLSTAQDSQTRKPLVEIVSKEWTASIPFDGSYLDTTTNAEKYPNAITLSDGKLATICYYDGGTSQYLRYRYTDSGRTTFTTVDIELLSAEIVSDVSLCELVNGNIGIVFVSIYGGIKRLKYRIITPAGVEVSNNTIRTFASSSLMVTGPFVVRLADDSYLMVFTEQVTADDPDHYHIYKYTSTNFTTWTGPTELSISGLDDTLYKRNPSLIQITTGQIWLWFDFTESIGPNDEELTNVYYSTSDDNGDTWSAAVKVTAYTQYSAVGNHPIAAQKVANALYMFFTEQRGSLVMDKITTGWPNDIFQDAVFNMHFDATNRKLYCVVGNRGAGWKSIAGVIKIDVDTWTIDKHWDTNSVPAIDSEYLAAGVSEGSQPDVAIGSGQYVVVIGPSNHNHKMACLIDGEADTIVNYYFNDMPDWGYAKNVTWSSTFSGFETLSYINNVLVDETRGRVWFHVYYADTYATKTWIGWIPLTSTSNHTATTFISSSSVMTGYQGYLNFTLKIIDEENWLILNMHSVNTGDWWKGKLCIFDIDSAALYKSFEYDTHGDFPYYGLTNPCYYDGKIYGGVLYQSQYAQSDFRGLCILDPFSEHIAYKRPSWGSYDDYKFIWIVPKGSDNKLIISSYGYGVTIYDIASETWELFDNTTVVGLTPSECDDFVMAVYDEAAGMIYGGVGDAYTSAWTGIVAFSIYGYIKQTHYYTGVYTDDWAWTDQASLMRGYVDYDAGIALDPSDSTIYAFWEKQDATEYSIKWDKEGVDFDLANYLVRGQPITCRRTINGDPAQLTFTVSHGHLFDPYNNASLLSTYMTKGRKITLRFGENVAGTEYWQAMGTFVITDQATSYKRGEYPVMTITAQDRSHFWSELLVIATPEYADTIPEEIIEDVIIDNTDLEADDIDLEFTTTEALTHQWIEEDLKSIVEQLADRFGYYLRVDVNDVVTAKRVSNANDVDHAYSDLTKLINWTPDDSYSDFTNRVIVTGEEDTEIDVTYPEERVAYLNGNFGWQGGTKTHIVWFSPDGSRRCRDARLVVLESTSSIAFALAGEVSETLLDNSYLDASENLRYKYCVVIIDAPDLVPHFIAALAGLVAAYMLGDLVVSFFGGYTIPVGSLIRAFFIFACLNILGAQGSYQYEIWAVPMGKIRRTVQGQWDDTAHQAQIAHVITKEYDDPLCHSVAACQFVAAQIGLVIQMQRRRVVMEKVAHLQDEDGDTITIPHPITGQAIKVFITDLERTMIIPELGSDNGSFTDKIEGWVL